MTAMLIPVAGWDRWLTVMERAGYRCQCTRCPGHARKGDGRCPLENMPGQKMLAGPVDPGPDPARTLAEVDVAELVAWCIPCWDRAVASARKTRRSAEQQGLTGPTTEPLF